MLNIALNELGGGQWTGGITYRNNLIKALEVYNPDFKVFFLSVNQQADETMDTLIPVQIRSGSNINRLINKITRKFIGYDYQMAKSISGKNIDVVFPHSSKAGRNTKSIYWIPDFQFVHLPHLYTKAQIDGFNTRLKKYFSDADLIVVSSEDAEKDFKNFAPEFIRKVRVMRFVAHVPKGLYDGNPEAVSTIYNLPTEFFYMPNQFWAHKNHKLVLEALKLLKDKGVEPTVVCTGNPSDVRNPGFLAELMQMIAEYGLHNQFRILGLLPHQHVYWLMRQCKCVLNPSLFEGWSTSVEESKSVGKRMILSDLEVHKEQDPAKSFFFNRYDAADLADKMEQAWNSIPAGPDIVMEELAKSQIEKRMKGFAARFIEICEEAKSN